MEAINMAETITPTTQRERLPWSEITDVEKLERIRTVLKETQNALGRTTERIVEPECIANRHQHAPDGSVMIRAENRYGHPMPCSPSCLPGKEWI